MRRSVQQHCDLLEAHNRAAATPCGRMQYLGRAWPVLQVRQCKLLLIPAYCLSDIKLIHLKQYTQHKFDLKLLRLCLQSTNCSEEVQARQSLNAELAMHLAEQQGLTWLLHIDSDELFYTPEPSVVQHFDWLDSQGILQLTYSNNEGVPEVQQCADSDYFEHVTLFKKHHLSLPLQAGVGSAME
jgi:hypothetical protein